jgi:hypothetical protein
VATGSQHHPPPPPAHEHESGPIQLETSLKRKRSKAQAQGSGKGVRKRRKKERSKTVAGNAGSMEMADPSKTSGIDCVGSTNERDDMDTFMNTDDGDIGEHESEDNIAETSAKIATKYGSRNDVLDTGAKLLDTLTRLADGKSVHDKVKATSGKQKKNTRHGSDVTKKETSVSNKSNMTMKRELRIRRLKAERRKRKKLETDVHASDVACEALSSGKGVYTGMSAEDANEKDEWYECNGQWYKGTKPDRETRDTGTPARENDNVQDTENTDEWYQWKGQWYQWNNTKDTKDTKRERINTRLRNWIAAMRRNMKAETKAAALHPFTITRDRFQEVSPEPITHLHLQLN